MPSLPLCFQPRPLAVELLPHLSKGNMPLAQANPIPFFPCTMWKRPSPPLLLKDVPVFKDCP
ncbi:hypothetical protein I79_005606 [Cricetulus griseus]|uniref:Uncharacterized protein n=1 Tax=Cricetulus griseus TaxID=10029 RepID=G3H5M1_CRIGR|nr:hypothetical protein I79_005606 [Cricetulus griseus]